MERGETRSPAPAGSHAHHLPSLHQLQHMGQDRVGGGGPQALIDAGVEPGHHGLDVGFPGRQFGQDLALALPAMLGVGVDERGHIRDRRAVRWPEGVEAPRLHLFEAGQIVAHVAVGRSDHRGRPAHDVIAAEQGVLLGEAVTDVVGGVPGRGDGLQGPARAFDHRPAADRDIGPEVIVASLELHLALHRLGHHRAAEHRCAGSRRQGPGQG